MVAKAWDTTCGTTADLLDVACGRQNLSGIIACGQAKTTGARSFLRWVGGKQRLIHELERVLPWDVRRRRYFEPFAGAANLFFALQPKSAVLSDLNEHLISCFSHVKDSPDSVAKYLRVHAINDNEAHYYEVRRIYNISTSSAAQAARFIYLNRTCFNGVFRVNMAGAFNVPYGYKSNPIIPSANELRAAGFILKAAKLKSSDYVSVISKAGPGTFTYVDPPYPPLNETAYFTHYTSNRFGDEDQHRLADCLRRLDKRGGLFLMSNADLPLIRKLYKEFHQASLSVKRSVSCKGARHNVGELIITNYPTSALLAHGAN